MSTDPRRYAPAASRNREPILGVLQQFLPAQGLVLEIASGTGEHVAHFAKAMPGLRFQPSDPDPDARASIDAWTTELGLSNVQRAIDLNAATQTWPLSGADAVVCINMIHISPWSSAIGLFAGAERALAHAPGGLLYLYGPFRRDGHHTSPSNADFDQQLRRQNAAWGIRDLEAVADIASQTGFQAPIVVPMPANNLSVIFQRI